MICAGSCGGLRQQEGGQRDGGALRLRPGDGDVGEVVRADPLLYEVDEARFGRPEGPGAKQGKALAVRVGQFRDHREGIQHQEAAMVFQPVARNGLADPAAELDLADRMRCAGIGESGATP